MLGKRTWRPNGVVLVEGLAGLAGSDAVTTSLLTTIIRLLFSCGLPVVNRFLFTVAAARSSALAPERQPVAQLYYRISFAISRVSSYLSSCLSFISDSYVTVFGSVFSLTNSFLVVAVFCLFASYSLTSQGLLITVVPWHSWCC